MLKASSNDEGPFFLLLGIRGIQNTRRSTKRKSGSRGNAEKKDI